MTPDDWDGWGRAWDQLVKRVDALERAVNQLVGRPPKAPPPSESDIKVGGLGVGTWIGLVAAVAVPIVVAIIMTGGNP